MTREELMVAIGSLRYFKNNTRVLLSAILLNLRRAIGQDSQGTMNFYELWYLTLTGGD